MRSYAFVLVPGAGGSASYGHLVAPELRARGHEAIPVELPAADDRAGLPDYAAAVVGAIGERDPESIVLVAQSLGGFVAPLVCERVRVALLVLVNAMIPTPGETPDEWWRNTRHAEAKREQNLRDGRASDAPFEPLIDFFHDVPQPVIDEGWAQGEPRHAWPPIVVASRAGTGQPRGCSLSRRRGRYDALMASRRRERARDRGTAGTSGRGGPGATWMAWPTCERCIIPRRSHEDAPPPTPPSS